MLCTAPPPAQHPPRAQRPCTVLPLGVTCYKKVRAEMCPSRAQTGELQPPEQEHQGCSQDRGAREGGRSVVWFRDPMEWASACLGSLLTQKHEINPRYGKQERGQTQAAPALRLAGVPGREDTGDICLMPRRCAAGRQRGAGRGADGFADSWAL